MCRVRFSFSSYPKVTVFQRFYSHLPFLFINHSLKIMFAAFLHSFTGHHIFKICCDAKDLSEFMKTIDFHESIDNKFDMQEMIKQLDEQTELTFDYIQSVDDLNNRSRKNLKSFNPIVLQVEKSNGDVLFVSNYDSKFITEYINKDSLINT